MDLGAALYGDRPVGVRRLLALVNGIGPRSALDRAVNPDGFWTQEVELLAGVLEALDFGNRIAWSTSGGRELRGDAPKAVVVPRPESLRPKKKVLTGLAAWKALAGMAKGAR